MGCKYSGSNLHGDIRNCSCYRAVKILEHGWNEGGEKGVIKSLCRIISVDEMQFGFMPERGTIDAVFICKRRIILK